MAGIRVERYSTASAPPASRLAFWNDLASETFNNLIVDASDGEAFHGEMVRAPLGRLSLMSADSSAARVTRINDPLRTARAQRTFDLHFQLSGRSLNSQSGRDALLEAGDFTLCDASQPYSVAFTEANHMLCLKLPAEALASRIDELDRVLCVPMSARRGGPATLAAFLRTVWDQMDEPGDEVWADTVSGVILDLIDLAYRPAPARQAPPSAEEQWRQKARAFIDEHLCDPDLGVGAVAAALGLSSRYVQLLFAASATTPSGYILDRRLSLAAERLRDAPQRRITEVAMAVGFNDLTHFGRAFRRRFGVAPRDFRAGVRPARWPAPAANDDDPAGRRHTRHESRPWPGSR